MASAKARLIRRIKAKITALDLVKRADAQLQAWLKRRAQGDTTHAVLSARNIYVLPNRYAFLSAALLFLLLLAATNYSNNMIFALVFWLFASHILLMYYAYANLIKLHITLLPIAPIFANHRAQIKVHCQSPKARMALALNDSPPSDLPILAWQSADLARGVHPVPRLKISSSYPSGLFFCWSWLYFGAEMVVYPHPQDFSASKGGHGGDIGSTQQAGDADFYGHRNHQPSDSPQRISWKALARTGTLYSKEFSQPKSQQFVLDYHQLSALNHEQRLSQLCFWILECEQQGQDYQLILPSHQSATSRGARHQRQLLTMLARADIGTP